MRSMTISEWAKRHGFSRAFFYKLESQGKAPRTFKVNSARRISEAADAEWLAAREAEAVKGS